MRLVKESGVMLCMLLSQCAVMLSCIPCYDAIYGAPAVCCKKLYCQNIIKRIAKEQESGSADLYKLTCSLSTD